MSGVGSRFRIFEAKPAFVSLVTGPERTPEWAGYKNTRYLTKVVFMPHRNGGYWSDRGYEWFGGT
jgi:hypothetical protein